MNEEVMMRPLYGSRMFWLGVPVLVFLLWAWMDSFTNVSTASSRMKVTGPGFRMETGGMELRVQRGMVIYYEGDVVVATPGVTVTRDGVRYAYVRGGYRFFGKQPWGFEREVKPLGVGGGGVALQSVQWWFPFGFVVAGYAVVWFGAVVLYRRWVRGKWEECRVMSDE